MVTLRNRLGRFVGSNRLAGLAAGAGTLAVVVMVATVASAAPVASATTLAPGHSAAPAAVAPEAPLVAPRYPPGLVAGPLSASLITPGAVSSARPWSAARPTGHGSVMTITFPAPWTGGIRTAIAVDVYLPPGYGTGTARYPVFYEVPDGISTWRGGMNLPGVLNSMIDSGSMPPVIFVFASQFGGPYPDSQCANSFDGREWLDRFLATDLVRWVDGHLRTIASPAARVSFGFSTGGYCSAELLANHPDVFGSAVVFSGYFVAGIHSGTTPDAWRPFNNDPAIVNAVSPMTVVPRISATRSASLFYVMEADPTQGFYGPQMEKFAAVLRAAGVPMALFPTPLGHSWAGARRIVPTMLQLVAGRMVSLGVYGPVGSPHSVPPARTGPVPA